MKFSIRIMYHLFVLLIIWNPIMAIEEPEYKVLKEFDEFEIRLYSPYLVAETEVTEEFEEAGNKAFRRLFDYISGNNLKQAEIEMTAPVNQTTSQTSGEKIEMTSPVTQQPQLSGNGKYIVSFVMPSNYTLQSIPQPKDTSIKIRNIDSRAVAVREFSGTWSEENYKENEELLLTELKNKGIEISGEPLFARYNPPFWPWFLRRNEVQIEVIVNDSLSEYYGELSAD